MRTVLFASIAAWALTAPLSPAHATIYTFTNFDAPGALQAGSYGTVVTGIDNFGHIVGYAYANGIQGFVYSFAANTFTTYDSIFLNGINDNGQIIGSNLQSLSFILDQPSGTLTFFPSNVTTTLTGIDNAGQVVGYTGNGARAPSYGGYIWDPTTGTFTAVNDPAGVLSPVRQVTRPADINNLGQIVGSIPLPGSGYSQGFLLDTSTGLYTHFSQPNAQTTEVKGINDVGQVVGYDGTNGFVLDLATGIYDAVIDPDAVSTFATGINNAGLIVGNFSDRLGISHGFIATPSDSPATVPEPASVVLLGCSVLGLRFVRRCTRNKA